MYEIDADALVVDAVFPSQDLVWRAYGVGGNRVIKRPFVRRADAALLTAVFPSQNPSETCSRVGDHQSAQLLEVGGRPQHDVARHHLLGRDHQL